MPSDNNLLTPLYQSALQLAVNTTLSRLLNQEYISAWQGIKGLYNSLPPSVEAEVKEQFETMNTFINEIHNHLTGDKLYHSNEEAEKESKYLSVEAWNIYHRIKDVMVEKGYYVFDSGRPTTRESSMKDLELTVGKAIYGKRE
jgi:hypothetical protein